MVALRPSQSLLLACRVPALLPARQPWSNVHPCRCRELSPAQLSLLLRPGGLQAKAFWPKSATPVCRGRQPLPQLLSFLAVFFQTRFPSYPPASSFWVSLPSFLRFAAF